MLPPKAPSCNSYTLTFFLIKKLFDFIISLVKTQKRKAPLLMQERFNKLRFCGFWLYIRLYSKEFCMAQKASFYLSWSIPTHNVVHSLKYPQDIWLIQNTSFFCS